MNNITQVEMGEEGHTYGGDYMVTVEDGVTVIRELDEIVISLEGFFEGGY